MYKLFLIYIPISVFLLIVIFIYYFYSDIVIANKLGSPNTSPTTQRITRSHLEQDELWTIIQQWKSENDPPIYQESKLSCDIADIRIKEIRNNYSHDGFEAYRFCSTDCELRENLARGYTDPHKILDDWLKSASHSASLKANYPYSCLRTNGTHVVHIISSQ